MNKATKLFIFISVALLLVSMGMAQTKDTDGYNQYPEAVQSKNIPTGLASEPGSQLIYLLDTGYDAKAELSGNADFGTRSVKDLASIEAPNFQNFISVTNTNPTDAVTVHFRYITSRTERLSDGTLATFCEDLLDFLVVLTCNDTMLVDPFDLEIPGTGLNVKTLFFGSSTAQGVLKGMPARLFDDGRFFLFVTASGDIVNNEDNYADWLFPNELVSFDDIEHCSAVEEDTIGTAPGIVNNNLHILNASAISFNYLTGFQTVAVPTAFLGPGAPTTANDLAYGVTAYARPAVYLGEDANEGWTGWPDGDGPEAPKRVVLAGSEEIPVTQSLTGATLINNYYLRNDAHGGDTQRINGDVRSEGGALAWTLFPIDGPSYSGVLPSDQFIYFVSMVDDYNGSSNAKKPAVAENDNSYGIDGALTLYELLVYNNDEEPFLPPPPDIQISPPPTFEPVSFIINTYCIDALNGSLTEEFGVFTIEDLHGIGGSDLVDYLAQPVGSELGPGWIRIIRNQTTVPDDPEYDGTKATFFTVGQQITRFEGFGVAWWLPTSAYVLPDEVCGGTCTDPDDLD